jgi:hypothetical protein
VFLSSPQKLIKELPSLVPADEVGNKQRARSESHEGGRSSPPLTIGSSAKADVSCTARRQNHGDKTTEAIKAAPGAAGHEDPIAHVDAKGQNNVIDKAPGEVAFFKLVHSEFKKAIHFFENAEREFIIREERVREGMEIMKRPNSIMVNDKWSLMAKSLYRLYKDLLLLETYAIMTYCSFSKILKKHDKVTGYDTRNAFMANVVNKANFTSYPAILEMITRCELMYEEVSQRLHLEGKEALYEDERLFINMIHRLNEQCMDSAEAEGVPGRQEIRRPTVENHTTRTTFSSQEKLSSLQILMADMDEAKAAGQVSDGVANEAKSSGRKRSSTVELKLSEKKQKS